MMVGLVGAGSMARALARGWGEAVLCTDGGSGRARELVAEVGGEALSSNAELAERADVVVLCHKPPQLEEVAREIDGRAPVVASVLAGTRLSALSAAYPGVPVVRLMPNLAVEVRAGVICHAHEVVGDELVPRVLELFGRLGTVVEVPEETMEVAMALAGCGPAFIALAAEAQADAAVAHGLPADLARRLAVDTLAGTAALIRARGGDAAGVREEVASPGGWTERGLEALERAAVRGAFEEAYRAMLEGRTR
jgi:pyrroline-5-carboxylate reductase